MPRKPLTLEALVTEGRFDPANKRHRAALDKSAPLADPQLEAARRQALDLRSLGDARVRAAQMLREFAALVEGRR